VILRRKEESTTVEIWELVVRERVRATLARYNRYRDTFTPDGGIWRIRHRKVSTDWAAPDSVMARPSR
jgi:hypothetical protein